MRAARPRLRLDADWRTADVLRPGDIVALFSRPVVVLAVYPDPDEAGHHRVIVLDDDRTWSRQSVPSDTLYDLIARGPLGRAFDHLLKMRTQP